MSKLQRISRVAASALALVFLTPVALDAETIEYHYDVLGRVVKACYNTQAKRVKYVYDAAGNRVTVSQAATCTAENPTAVDDDVFGQFATFTGVTVNVLSNDSDPDGDTILVTQASCISGGCDVSIQGGGTSIFVVGTTAGSKQVSYTISDGQGGVASATATVSSFEDLCGEVFC